MNDPNHKCSYYEQDRSHHHIRYILLIEAMIRSGEGLMTADDTLIEKDKEAAVSETLVSRMTYKET